MMYADPDKRPMMLTLAGTVIALLIISFLWMTFHKPTEPQPVDSYKIDGTTMTPAQRSAPAIGE